MLGWLKRRPTERPFQVRKVSESELIREYNDRVAFAQKTLSNDPLAMQASIEEINHWLRQKVKERITAPL